MARKNAPKFLCGKHVVNTPYCCERDEHHIGECMGQTLFPYGARDEEMLGNAVLVMLANLAQHCPECSASADVLLRHYQRDPVFFSLLSISTGVGV